MVKQYIDEILGKGFIRRSTLLYAASVLIIKKPDRGLRICIDYRLLNSLTIRNRNVPPLIRETLSRLYRIRRYSKFDIIATFNEIRIKEGYEEKTTFLIRYRLFEYTIIPFRLYNTPSTFQAFITKVLREYLDIFYSAYLDNILIYSDDEDNYVYYVSLLLEKL